MKRKIALSLVALMGASAFAGGGHPDLYSTKGCHQEYNGYWGFGAGWNHDNNESAVRFENVMSGSTTVVGKVSADESGSEGVGHLFMGYSFYNDMPYSVAVEAGMYTSGKETSYTRLVDVTNGGTGPAVEVSVERKPAYYLAFKPRYNSGDWWVNVTLGAAATTYRVKGELYDSMTVAGATNANLVAGSSDGFTTYGWMLGAGVGMWFNPNWAVSLDYDYMRWSSESSKTDRDYTAGVLSSYTSSKVKDGTSSHFVTLNLKNNFNWFA